MVHEANADDVEAIARLAVSLWPEHTQEELAAEFTDIMNTGNARFFLKVHNDMPVGFAQCQLRYDYVEGTESRPVGYLEGIFIKEECRHKGFAGELLSYCEKWAEERGCTEFASDCELDNHDSLLFHRKMGFSEANRIICFTKKIKQK